MNHQKIYDQIIEKRKVEEPIEYYENHHIIPKSLGGSDEKENLVKLTAREHFICHYLLTKIHQKESFEWYKMIHAFMMMKWNSLTQNRYFNSRLYELSRKQFSVVMSFLQSGSKNSQYGKVRCVPIDAENCKKHVGYFPDQIPDGWITTKEWKELNKKEKIKKPNGFKGKTHSLETKEKIRKKKLGVKRDQEFCENQSKTRLGRIHMYNPITKEKRFIKNEDFNYYLSLGFIKRCMN